MVVRCSLFVVCCLLIVVCCSLCVVCCLLFVVCCGFIVGLLLVVLFVGVTRGLFVAYCLLDCFVMFAVCRL